MAEDTSNAGGNEQSAPKNASQLLAQIDASIAKKDLESVKSKATEIKTKINEHKRSIRLLEAELAELVGRFEAGLL